MDSDQIHFKQLHSFILKLAIWLLLLLSLSLRLGLQGFVLEVLLFQGVAQA